MVFVSSFILGPSYESSTAIDIAILDHAYDTISTVQLTYIWPLRLMFLPHSL